MSRKTDQEMTFTVVCILLFAWIIMFFLTLFTLNQQYKTLAGIITEQMRSTVVCVPESEDEYEISGNVNLNLR